MSVKAKQNFAFGPVLMDTYMPEMDGVEATKAIRKMSVGEQIPIKGLTTKAYAERHIIFKQAGMDDIITKPFTEERLRSALGKFKLLPLKIEP